MERGFFVIKRILSLSLAFAMILTLFSCVFNVAADEIEIETEGAEITEEETVVTDTITLVPEKEVNYKDYIANLKDKTNGKNTYYADIMADTYVFSSESEEIHISINVEEAGFYNIEVEYNPIEGALAAVERKFFINGKQPFKELANIRFERQLKKLEASLQSIKELL